MRNGRIWLLLFLALASCLFATDGTFLGTIVSPPGQEAVTPGWIFVQGRNRMVRRVDVTHATIVPAQGTAPGQGKKCGAECLAIGQEVRVTAEQDSRGEWRAKRVEILRPAADKVPGDRSGTPMALPALGISPGSSSLACPERPLEAAKGSRMGRQNTYPRKILGSWITVPDRLCIQPLTEKSIITRWSGGIMNDVL